MQDTLRSAGRYRDPQAAADHQEEPVPHFSLRNDHFACGHMYGLELRGKLTPGGLIESREERNASEERVQFGWVALAGHVSQLASGRAAGHSPKGPAAKRSDGDAPGRPRQWR